MKKQYQVLAVVIDLFETEDIITTSGLVKTGSEGSSNFNQGWLSSGGNS